MNQSLLRWLSTLVVCWVTITVAYAQPFPISSSTTLTTPTLPYLDQYIRENPTSIINTMILNDITKPTYDVILKLKISGVGIVIQSREDFFSQAYTLSFGVPRTLTGFELAELFNPDALDFQGITREEFLQTGRLPEGIYSICIEAYDVDRFDELPVSNLGCAIGMLEEQEPPTLIAPEGLQDKTFPQYFQMLWQPLHRPGIQVEYDLTLYQVIPGYTDDQIFTFEAPIYKVTTTTPFYQYTPVDPKLTVGLEYIWRVQVRTNDGSVAFKNDGYSEAERFLYGVQMLPAPFVTSPFGTRDCEEELVINWNPGHQEPLPVEYELYVYSTENHSTTPIQYSPVGVSPGKVPGGKTNGGKSGGNSGGKNGKNKKAGKSGKGKTTPPAAGGGKSAPPTSNNTSSTSPLGGGKVPYTGPTVDVNDLYLVYNTTLQGGPFSYSDALPEIYWGENYYVQVRAVKPAGSTAAVVYDFVNDGYSNIKQFACDDDCKSPTILTEDVMDEESFMITWNERNNVDKYQVRYNIEGENENSWIYYTTTGTEAEFEGLLPGAIYDYQVTAICAVGDSAAAIPDSVLLDPGPEESLFYSCGMEPDPIDMPGYSPLPELFAGDSIYAADFKIKITAATGGNGKFSGQGYIEVPYLQMARVNVVFAGVDINSEHKLASGSIKVTGAGAAILSEDMIALLDQLMSIIDSVDGFLEQAEELFFQIELLGDYYATLQGLNPYLPENVAEGVMGAYDCFEFATTDADIAACQSSLDSAMAVMEGVLDSMFRADYQIVFDKNDPSTLKGFDKLEYEVLQPYYTNVTIAEENYATPWKSVESGETDYVELSSTTGSIPTDMTITDQNENEITLESANTASTRKFQITGDGDKKKHRYYAIQEDLTGETDSLWIAGILDVISYDPATVDVVIVPVNTASFPVSQTSLQTKLAKVFDQAIVNTTTAVMNPGINIPDFDGQIKDLTSSWSSAYSSDQNDIISYFKNNATVEDNKAYVFVIASSTMSGLKGFMPKNKQFGFIFKDALSGEDDYIKTIAHELGHGLFNLDHTWQSFNGLAQGSTNNLMDYGAGSHLIKPQWDKVHNPGTNWTLFDGDEEGALNTLTVNKCIPWDATRILQHDYFYAPDTSIIRLQLNDIPLAVMVEANGAENWQLGSITAFRRNGNNYGAVFEKLHTNGVYEFMGYKILDEANSSPGDTLAAMQVQQVPPPDSLMVVMINDVNACQISINGIVQTDMNNCLCEPGQFELVEDCLPFLAYGQINKVLTSMSDTRIELEGATDLNFLKSVNGITEFPWPIGSVTSYTKDGIKYIAFFNPDSPQDFVGYIDENQFSATNNIQLATDQLVAIGTNDLTGVKQLITIDQANCSVTIDGGTPISLNSCSCDPPPANELVEECLPLEAIQYIPALIFKSLADSRIELAGASDFVFLMGVTGASQSSWPVGSLTSFVKSEKKYVAYFNPLSPQEFVGYIDENDIGAANAMALAAGELEDLETNNLTGDPVLITIDKENCSFKMGENNSIPLNSCDCKEELVELHTVEVNFETNHDNALEWVTNWHKVNLEFNEVSWAEEYIIEIKLNSELGIHSSRTSSMQSPLYQKIEIPGTNGAPSTYNIRVQLNYNSLLGNMTIPKSDKFTYYIYPLATAGAARSSAPYYFTSESGRFYYNYPADNVTVDQSICKGNTAKLGVTYQNNDWTNPCSNSQTIPEVNPQIYDFVWNDPDLEPYPQNCSSVEPSKSRSNTKPTEDTYFELTRSLKAPSGLFAQGATTEVPAMTSVSDVAEIFINVWSEGEQGYVWYCEFSTVVEDLTGDPISYPNGYNSSNKRYVYSFNTSTNLEVVRDNFDGFKFSALPKSDFGFSIASDPKWIGVVNSDPFNDNIEFDLSGFDTEGIDPEYITYSYSHPNFGKEYYDIAAEIQGENDNPKTEEVSVEVFSRDPIAYTGGDYRLDNYDDFCTDVLVFEQVVDQWWKDFLKKISSDVENPLWKKLANAVKVDFVCESDKSDYSQINVERYKKSKVVRNWMGSVENKLGVTFKVNIDGLDLLKLYPPTSKIAKYAAYGITCPLSANIPLQGVLQVDIDEKKYTYPLQSPEWKWDEGGATFAEEILSGECYVTVGQAIDEVSDQLDSWLGIPGVGDWIGGLVGLDPDDWPAAGFQIKLNITEGHLKAINGGSKFNFRLCPQVILEAALYEKDAEGKWVSWGPDYSYGWGADDPINFECWDFTYPQ